MLGVLHAASRQPSHFTQAQADGLELVAAPLARAMERVRRFEAERQARQRSEELVDRLDRLQRITSSLARAIDEDQVAVNLSRSLSSATSEAHPERCTVWVRHGDRLIVASLETDIVGVLGEVSLRSDFPLAQVARAHRPVFVSSAEEGLARFPSLAQMPFPFQSFALIPLMIHDECLGVLACSNPRPHEFAPDEQEFLNTVAGQVAQGLDRARSYSRQAQLAVISAFLANAAKVMAEAPSFAETLARLADLALPALGDICLIDVLGDDDTVERMVARHRDPERQPLVDRLRAEYAPSKAGGHPAVRVIGEGRPMWSREMSDDFLRATTLDDEHFALTKALGFRSYLSVPLRFEDEVRGSITFISAGRSFELADVTFATELAEQVAAVVGHAHRYEVAYRTSVALQENLLPQQLPEIAGVATASRHVPSTRGLEVGGDFFDLLALPGGRAGFVIGDVEGHDGTAAAMMGQLRSAVRALAGQVSTSEDLIRALQWSWPLLGFGRIVTMLFGELDPATGRLALVSAGHPPPLLVGSADTRFVDVVPTSPLGSVETAITVRRERLVPGDILLGYTDGVIDDRLHGPEPGLARLAQTAESWRREALGSGRPGGPNDLCRCLIEVFPGNPSDDVALLAVQYRGAPAAPHRSEGRPS